MKPKNKIMTTKEKIKDLSEEDFINHWENIFL